MKHAHVLTTLNELTLTIDEAGHVIASGPVGDFSTISAGAQIAVDGTLPQSVFVYVLQLGPNGQVVILHHPAQKSPVGVNVRIPDGAAFLTTVIEGEVTVVGSDTKVMDSEWPSILGGHDGDTQSGHIKESTVGPPAAQPPAPPAPPPPPAVKPPTPPTSSGR